MDPWPPPLVPDDRGPALHSMLPRRLANRGGARRSGRAKQLSPSHRPKGTAEVIQGDKARVGRLARPNASKKYLQDPASSSPPV